MAEYYDVLAYHDWQWKFGFGERNPEVQRVAQTFKLEIPALERRSSALSALELIVGSDLWAEEAALSQEVQERRRKLHGG
jgi:hypothetical protein